MKSTPHSWGTLEVGRKAVERSVGFELRDGPLHVVAARDVCSTEAGQIALLSFLNMACRSHRPITLELPSDVPLLIEPLVGSAAGGSLCDAGIALIHAIAPTSRVWPASRPSPEAITVGFGPVDRRCRWHIGVNRAIATITRSRSPTQDWHHSGSKWGAALAACLAASAVFLTVHGRKARDVQLSAWNLREGRAATLGPDGPFPVAGGSKLLIGAGAVASALVYWLHHLGAVGPWSVVDADAVSDSNLVKGLALADSDVGKAKARHLASFLPDASSEVAWYADSKLAGKRHDLVLCLANEFDVRTQVSSRDPDIVLHATTGEAFDVFLHRHIRLRDDCVRCRTRDMRQAVMKCSSIELPVGEGKRADTALPFAAGFAGLVLASALSRLEAGELAEEEVNQWAFYFASDPKRPFVRSWRSHCWDDCHRGRLAPLLPGRWAHLDPRARTS